MTLQEFRNNKLRTFLSLSGISIGIFCVVSVFTMTKSLELNIRSEMSTLGNEVIYLQKWPWGQIDGAWWRYQSRPNPDYQEFRQLKERLQDVGLMAYVYASGQKTIQYEDSYMDGVTMLAPTTNFSRIQHLNFSGGRFFNEREEENGGMVLIAGSNIWSGFFDTPESALTKVISLNGFKFTIIGTLQKYGDNMIGGLDYDNSVIIPYRAGLKIVNDRNQDPFIMLAPVAPVGLSELKAEARGAMRGIRKLGPKQEDNFELNELSMLADFTQKIFGNINAGGLFIGIFALLVGAFGVANIMYVTVKERTGIIGLKKAMGAKRRSILIEFLIEAILLCLFGGLLGMLLVFGLTKAISSFVFFKIQMTTGIILFGILISVITGLISGLLPAFSASKMDPVVAIRS